MSFLKHFPYMDFIFLTITLFFGIQTFAQDYTIPGEVTTPSPNIINLAVEWNIQGDNNQNAIVMV